MSGLTPKLPLIRSDEDGTYKLIKSYKNLIKQNFRNLILTAPGERMMDPNFGVGIRNYLFENDGDALYSTIRAKIHEQVTRYIPIWRPSFKILLYSSAVSRKDSLAL